MVVGGGQSDRWHSLTCRGKYAGEIRMEITYYDSRPKPQNPAPKPAAVPSGSQREEVTRVTPKRRPLPSDPVTGEAPTPPAPQTTPQHAQTPPRPLQGQHTSLMPNKSPSQGVEYQISPSSQPRDKSQPLHVAPQTPQHSQTPPQHSGRYSPNPKTPNSFGRGRHAQAQDISIAYPSHRAMPEPIPHQHGQIESFGHQYENGHPADGHYKEGYQTEPVPPQHHHQVQQYEQLDARYNQMYDDRHTPRSTQIHHELPAVDDPRPYPLEDDRPPPPPVHRSRTSLDGSPANNAAPSMRQDVLRSEAHRSSLSSSAPYPGRPQYKPHDSAPFVVPQRSRVESRGEDYHPLPPHHSLNPIYDSQYRSIKPTFKDHDSSPAAQQYHNSSYYLADSRSQRYEEAGYVTVPTTAPLSTSGRSSAGSGMSENRGRPAAHPHLQNDCKVGASYGRSCSPNPPDFRRSATGAPPHQSFHSQEILYMSRRELENNELAIVPHKSSSAYKGPDVPGSLAAVGEPFITQGITDRIYKERRPDLKYTQHEVTTPTRGQQETVEHRRSADHRDSFCHRGSIDSRDCTDHRSSYGPSGSAVHHQKLYTPPDWEDNNQALTYVGSHPGARSAHDANAVSRQREASASPQQAIKRKSVSPAPASPMDKQRERRHSGIPFGPDSYDGFNPTLARAKEADPIYSDPDTKIITHDGREVDPSDHLPMSSWAPEPDKRPKEESPDSCQRHSPSGPQPMPSGGRGQVRARARPQSMSVPSHSNEEPESSVQIHSSSGRNRLQKKSTQRTQALPGLSKLPAPASSSGPLVPLDNTPGGSGFTPPRHMSRASTFDVNGSENRESMYGSSPTNRGDYRSGYGNRDDPYDRGYRAGPPGPPPVPAKVPLELTMSGANGPSRDDEWALMQEMQSIDLGSGRSRRHRGY